jgi:hypothetical protein
MNYLSTLLKSKRFWVIVVTAGAHLLVKRHIILSADAVNDIADQLVLAAGSLCVVGTKVWDSRQPPQ